MGDKCQACLRDLSGDLIRHGEMPEGAVVDDAKFDEIDAIFGTLLKDLDFRSRIGLASLVKRVRSWFHFHGPWFPDLPAKAKEAGPKTTLEHYLWMRDFCEFLAQKSWADEVHRGSCAAHRELVREVVQLNSR